METLSTERLILRPYESEDVAFLHDLHSRPEVTQWLGDGEPQPELAQAEQRLQRYVGYRDEPVHGIWAVLDAATEAPVGTALLKSLPASAGPGEEERPSEHTEIGWHFHPQAWGQGYATEAAAAVLRHAFDAGLDHVLAVTNPANAASQAVARRIGMRDQGLTRDFYNTSCRLFRADAEASSRTQPTEASER